MRVEMLNVGWFTSPAGIWRQGDDMEQRVRFPVPAYLIETETERILVDTGLHPGAVADPAGHYEDAPALAIAVFEQDASVADQVDLATITKVVMTHLHFDHAGGLDLLPRSVPIFIQQREWAGAHDLPTMQRNFFIPRDYAAIADQVVVLDGDHDLLGDGSLVLLSTPGHTPGHQSVRVGESLVIGGDVSHYASGLDDHRFPVFADDFDNQKTSAEQLRALRDAGTVVRPGHDPELLVPGPIPVG
jgi:glyoxylase-like metal-dependent hydrolase (beta-lactamase superfamily II)